MDWIDRKREAEITTLLAWLCEHAPDTARCIAGREFGPMNRWFSVLDDDGCYDMADLFRAECGCFVGTVMLCAAAGSTKLTETLHDLREKKILRYHDAGDAPLLLTLTVMIERGEAYLRDRGEDDISDGNEYVLDRVLIAGHPMHKMAYDAGIAALEEERAEAPEGADPDDYPERESESLEALAWRAEFSAWVREYIVQRLPQTTPGWLTTK